MKWSQRPSGSIPDQYAGRHVRQPDGSYKSPHSVALGRESTRRTLAQLRRRRERVGDLGREAIGDVRKGASDRASYRAEQAAKAYVGYEKEFRKEVKRRGLGGEVQVRSYTRAKPSR